MKDKIINLSWLVEKWTVWDDPYIKSIWLNLKSLDLIRISEGLETEEDMEYSYIDIENNPEDYVCMPNSEEIDIKTYRDSFINSLEPQLRDQFTENYNIYSGEEEFLDKVYELGLEKDLQEYRQKVAAKILWEWATDENLKVRKDIDF